MRVSLASRLDMSRTSLQRLLPTEIIHIQRHCLGQAFMYELKLSSSRYLLHTHRRLHSPRQARIAEAAGSSKQAEQRGP